MDAKMIITQGEAAKYQLNISRPDFNLLTDDVKITLSWGFQGSTLVINKSDLYFDEEGRCFFAFDTTNMLGRVTATCEYDTPDSDFPEGVRTDVDRQILCFVSSASCTRFPRFKCTCEGDHYVTYTRILRSDASTAYLIVRTSEQEVVKTSENEVLRVHKTDEELNY